MVWISTFFISEQSQHMGSADSGDAENNFALFPTPANPPLSFAQHQRASGETAHIKMVSGLVQKEQMRL